MLEYYGAKYNYFVVKGMDPSFFGIGILDKNLPNNRPKIDSKALEKIDADYQAFVNTMNKVYKLYQEKLESDAVENKITVKQYTDEYEKIVKGTLSCKFVLKEVQEGNLFVDFGRLSKLEIKMSTMDDFIKYFTVANKRCFNKNNIIYSNSETFKVDNDSNPFYEKPNFSNEKSFNEKNVFNYDAYDEDEEYIEDEEEEFGSTFDEDEQENETTQEF